MKSGRYNGMKFKDLLRREFGSVAGPTASEVLDNKKVEALKLHAGILKFADRN